MESRLANTAHFTLDDIKEWLALQQSIASELNSFANEQKALDHKCDNQKSALDLLAQKQQNALKALNAAKELSRCETLMTVMAKQMATQENELAQTQRHVKTYTINLAMQDSKFDIQQRQLTILELKDILTHSKDKVACDEAGLSLKKFLPYELTPAFPQDKHAILDKLQSLSATRKELADKLYEAKHECQMLDTSFAAHTEELARLKAKRAELQKLAGDFQTLSVAEVDVLYAEALKEWAVDTTSKIKIQAFLDHLTTEKEKLDKHYKEREANLKQLNDITFLVDLRDKPDHLVKILTSSIQAIHQLFLERYPAQQHEDTRLYIARWHTGMKAILAQGHARDQYYQLMGLLWKHYEDIKNDELHQTLQTYLLESNLWPMDCLAAYEQWMNDTQFTEVTRETLIAVELTAFDEAYATAQQALQTVPAITSVFKAVHSEAKEVMDIAKQQANVIKQSGKGDTPYYTQVLHQTAALLHAPGNPSLHAKYRRLAEHDKLGKPSLLRKIGGAMVLFLSAVVAAAGTLLLLAMLGVNLPFSLLSHIAACATTSKLAASGAATVALATLGVGVDLFYSGTRRGLSKHVCRLEERVTEASTVSLRAAS